MIHEIFDGVKYATDSERVLQRSPSARWQRRSPALPNTEREKLYLKIQDIHNYKAEYELKCEAEAALESDLYRLGQLDGMNFIKGDRSLWHHWSYKKGYGIGIEKHHDLAYAS